MVATAKKFPARADAEAEERALQELNRLFAKAAPIAARKRKKALKRLRDDIAARITRVG
jgi:F0F1-type ATP synthase membrane subunit b/b'